MGHRRAAGLHGQAARQRVRPPLPAHTHASVLYSYMRTAVLLLTQSMHAVHTLQSLFTLSGPDVLGPLKCCYLANGLHAWKSS